MNRVLKYVKKNISSFICFLMAIIVALTATLSYARYITDGKFGAASSIGSFSCSATIDGVSAVSFTNTAFWGGTAEDDRNDIAMNALRSLHFSVNNYDVVNGNKVVNEVRTRYTLIFTAPQTFAERLAIQLFNGETGVPMLPQILLSDIVENADSTFDTGVSDNFNGDENIDDVTLSVVHSSNKYIATHDPNASITGDETVITLTEEILPLEQTLYFRLWDVSSITNAESPTVSNEIGTLLAPMCVTYSENVSCYKISISMPEFVHSAGIEETHNYSLTLAPTSTLNDSHLGGYMVKSATDHSIITSLQEEQLITMQTITEHIVDTYSDGTTEVHDSKTLLGGVKVYNVGDYETTDVTTPEPVEVVIEKDPVVTTGTYEKYAYYEKSGNKFTFKEVRDLTDSSTRPTDYRITVSATSTTTETRKIVATAYKNTRTTETITGVETSADGTVTLTIKRTVHVEYADVTGIETVYSETKYTNKEWGTPQYYKTGNNSGWQNATGNNKITDTNSDKIPPTDTEADPKEEAITSLDATETTVTFTRTIQRVYDTATTITAKSVSRNVADSDGNLTAVSYPIGSPFTLYDSNGIQKFYLSQCYSKNYPFTVNVLFEQTSN